MNQRLGNAPLVINDETEAIGSEGIFQTAAAFVHVDVLWNDLPSADPYGIHGIHGIHMGSIFVGGMLRPNKKHGVFENGVCSLNGNLHRYYIYLYIWYYHGAITDFTREHQ